MRAAVNLHKLRNGSIMHRTMPAVLCSQTKFRKQTIIFSRFCRLFEEAALSKSKFRESAALNNPLSFSRPGLKPYFSERRQNMRKHKQFKEKNVNLICVSGQRTKAAPQQRTKSCDNPIFLHRSETWKLTGC